MNIGPSLVEAARIFQDARRAGVSVGEALGPADAFARPDPVAERLVRLAYGDGASGARMSRERFAEVLNAYSDRAMEEAGQTSMFGGNLSAAELLDGAAARVAQAPAEAALPLSAPDGG